MSQHGLLRRRGHVACEALAHGRLRSVVHDPGDAPLPAGPDPRGRPGAHPRRRDSCAERREHAELAVHARRRPRCARASRTDLPRLPRALWTTVYKDRLEAANAAPDDPEHAEMLRVQRSAQHLADHFEEYPLLLFSFVQFDPSGGSIFPATWSAMLAARAEGIGASLTSVFLFQLDNVLEILGVPKEEGWLFSSCVTFGYPTGRWGVAPRRPVHEVAFRNTGVHRWASKSPSRCGPTRRMRSAKGHVRKPTDGDAAAYALAAFLGFAGTTHFLEPGFLRPDRAARVAGVAPDVDLRERRGRARGRRHRREPAHPRARRPPRGRPVRRGVPRQRADGVRLARPFRARAAPRVRPPPAAGSAGVVGAARRASGARVSAQDE